MQYLKLENQNVTHKFNQVPQNFNELEKIVQKTFKKSLQDNKLFFQNTAIQSDEDYKFLLSQSDEMNRTLKLSIKPNKNDQQNYFLLFPEDQSVKILQQYKPQYSPPQLTQKNKKLQKSCQTKQERRQENQRWSHNVIVSTPRILQRENQKIMTILIQNLEKNHLPQNCGILHVNTNKVYYFDNQIEQDEIKQLEIPYQRNENQENQENDVYRLVYFNSQGMRRIFGKKIIVRDWRHNARRILAQAIEVQTILGGDVIDYVKFIKSHRLENECVDEITEKIVDEAC